MTTAAAKPFSNLQQELLKLYAADIPDVQLLYIKEMIAKYLWEQAKDEADRVWQEKGYSEQTLKTWLNED